MSTENRKREITEHLRKVLELMGEDPDRDGIIETPQRWAKSLLDIVKGKSEDPRKHLKMFPNEGYEDVVEITKIPFYSTCEHHILPFFGTVNIAYVPAVDVLGLSKFARIVDVFARQLQTQEYLTKGLHEFFFENLSEHCVVQIKAEHACVCSRGVMKEGVETVTRINTIPRNYCFGFNHCKD